mmetsp:Transcript_1578/g.6248  ORF Transcript_1578/g.6248 Transcript_1578/m.6248 type:complete len:449 (+) Transcript_1578:638-1984(+)
MRVDDDVRRDPLYRERHVLLDVGHAHGALLPVARRELVADLWDANRADARLDEAHARIVGGDHHLVHDAGRRRAQRRRAVALGVALRPPILGRHGRGLADDDVLARDARARRRQPVLVELVILRRLPHPRRVLARGPLDHLLAYGPSALLLISVGAVEHRPHEPPINRALVHNQGVLLVVARVNHDRHDRVLPRGQLTEVQELHAARRDQRFLRVVQDVPLRLEPQIKVGGVHAHRLLAHRTLVHVARRLVVVREGYDTATDAQDHRWVNLAMCIARGVRVRGVRTRSLKVTALHGDHGRLLLFTVDVLHHAPRHQVVPAEARALAVAQLGDCVFLDQQALVLHDEQRAAHAPAVGIQAHLLQPDVVHDRHLLLDVDGAPQVSQCADEHLGVAVHADPHAVDEHLGVLGDHRRLDLLEIFRRPLVEELEDGPARAADRDVRHQGQVLH